MAPQAAPQELARDPRVRQTLELQRKAAEQLKKTGADSPRTKGLIVNLSAVLGAYGISDAEIRNLVKRCNYNDTQIQAAVSHILEERSGHEHGAWATTATASDKKAKVQEAKERRERREREKEEEVERQKQDRQRQAEEVRRKAKEEAQRIRAEEVERQRRLVAPATAQEQQPDRSRGDRQERSSAWRAPEDDLSEVNDSLVPEDTPVERAWENEGDGEEAEAEEEVEMEEEVEDNDEGIDDENEEDEAEETAAPAESPETWPAPGVAAVPEASMPSAPPTRDPWGSAPPAPQNSPWAAPNLLDGKPWCPGQVSDQSSAASLPVAQVSDPRVARDGGVQQKDATVIMPASHKALIGEGPEPFIQFGTLYLSDSSPAASSTKPIPSPEEGHAAHIEDDPEKDKTRDGQDEGRSQRAPRGGRRNKGNDWSGGAHDEAKAEGQGKGKNAAKGDSEGRSQKKDKENKGEGKGKGKSQGKAEGKGGSEGKGESKGEAKGENKGEGKSASSRARGGKWRPDRGDRGGGK